MIRQMLIVCVSAALLMSSGCNLLQKRCTNCGKNQATMQQTAQAGMYPQAMQAQGTPQMMQAQAMAPASPMMPQAGPNSAAYAYPYYTVRAPRDFLMKNPPSIGN